MLIVAGTITTAPGKRDEMLGLAQSLMAATRAEDGCHEYVFTPDTGEDDLVRLYELWESGEHLAAHAKAPHIAEWRQASADLVIASSIKVFTISESRDL